MLNRLAAKRNAVRRYSQRYDELLTTDEWLDILDHRQRIQANVIAMLALAGVFFVVAFSVSIARLQGKETDAIGWLLSLIMAGGFLVVANLCWHMYKGSKLEKARRLRINAIIDAEDGKTGQS